MSEEDLQKLLQKDGVAEWRRRLARWVESARVQQVIIVLIMINAIVLGLETSPTVMETAGGFLKVIDKICLIVFVIEILIKLVAYRWSFWRNGWNWFDFWVVAIALMPATGALSVLRALRVLRVLRLFTAIPALRKVVAAFLHAIPGLTGVMAVMMIFFYVCGVLATKLFGEAFPDWFGNLGASLIRCFKL